MSYYERTKRASLGRVALRRVARPRLGAGAEASREAVVSEAAAEPRSVPWSRGLWGVFLPDRRTDARPLSPSAVDRRAGLSPTA